MRNKLELVKAGCISLLSRSHKWQESSRSYIADAYLLLRGYVADQIKQSSSPSGPLFSNRKSLRANEHAPPDGTCEAAEVRLVVAASQIRSVRTSSLHGQSCLFQSARFFWNTCQRKYERMLHVASQRQFHIGMTEYVSMILGKVVGNFVYGGPQAESTRRAQVRGWPFGMTKS